MTDIHRFLEANGIAFEHFDHPAVYTVADVRQLAVPIPGARTKNLFLRDNKGRRHFLVVTADDKKVDLKRLHTAIGSTRLSFGSPQRLQRHLGVDPGAVSALALVNDAAGAVELFWDRDLWAAEAFQCHPLVNTATLVLSRENIIRLAAPTRHVLQLIEVPQAAEGGVPGTKAP